MFCFNEERKRPKQRQGVQKERDEREIFSLRRQRKVSETFV